MRQPRGFTLLETIMVMGMFGMVIGLGWLFSFTYLKNQEVRSAADILTSEIGLAQADAFAQTDDRAHGVKVFTDHVIRYEGTSYAARVTSKDVTTSFTAPVTVGSVSEVDFPAGGLVPSSATTITLQNGTLAIDLSLTAYGVLNRTERTIGS